MVIRIYKKPNKMYDVFECNSPFNIEHWLFSYNHPDNVFSGLSHLTDNFTLEFINQEFEQE